MTYEPRFSYDHAFVRHLGEIDAARAAIELLPLPLDASLRLYYEARQRSTRGSTAIKQAQVTMVG